MKVTFFGVDPKSLSTILTIATRRIQCHVEWNGDKFATLKPLTELPEHYIKLTFFFLWERYSTISQTIREYYYLLK